MTGRQLSDYLVGPEIGHGRMGIVYQGTDTRLNRTVALKFLTKALPADAAERKRFLREARAASSANHPNVCVIHAIEEVEGEEFIVMIFLEGTILRTWAAQKRRGSEDPQSGETHRGCGEACCDAQGELYIRCCKRHDSSEP